MQLLNLSYQKNGMVQKHAVSGNSHPRHSSINSCRHSRMLLAGMTEEKDLEMTTPCNPHLNHAKKISSKPPLEKGDWRAKELLDLATATQ
jgi:hypothetical protein